MKKFAAGSKKPPVPEEKVSILFCWF
jgi:hypothetical protein